MTFQGVGEGFAEKLGGSLLCRVQAARTFYVAFDVDNAPNGKDEGGDTMVPVTINMIYNGPDGKEEGGGFKEGQEDAVHQLVHDHLESFVN